MYMSIYQINNLASLLYQLAKYKPQFVIHIIDELYEKIINTLESNDFKQYTFLIQYTHLFADLYNYKILNSTNVLDLLYYLISLTDINICYMHEINYLYPFFLENKKFIEHIKVGIYNIGNVDSEFNKITTILDMKRNRNKIQEKDRSFS